MPRRFQTGLVVGKFSPLHAGHRHLLDQAERACERLVIISYSRPEFAGCTAELRQQWLRQAHPNAHHLVLDAAAALVLGLDMPSNYASDLQQRQFCAALIDRWVGTPVDAVFSSEDYGQGFADFLAAHWGLPVASILVDPKRKHYPISGTELRTRPDPRWVGDQVFRSQSCQRIALIGAESTGKTTLGQWLAKQHGWPWVEEFGRQHWHQCGGELTPDDLLIIAHQQVENEKIAVQEAVHAGQCAVVCDTTPLTTLIYHRLLFNPPPPLNSSPWRNAPITNFGSAPQIFQWSKTERGTPSNFVSSSKRFTTRSLEKEGCNPRLYSAQAGNVNNNLRRLIGKPAGTTP